MTIVYIERIVLCSRGFREFRRPFRYYQQKIKVKKLSKIKATVFPSVSRVFDMIFRQNDCLRTTYALAFRKTLTIFLTVPKMK